MTREEKINYLKIALNLQNIGVSKEVSDRIIETYEKVLLLKGEFSLNDAVDIEISMDRKYKKKKLES